MNDAIAKIAATQIQRYMAQHGIKQRELAIMAGISQATVSRALKGNVLRNGTARNRLFILVGFSESEYLAARARVMTAFDRIWNHTEPHASAVERVIDALGNFLPPS